MKRTILLATSALVAFAVPAFADGKGGSHMSGLGEFGYDYTDLDDFNLDRSSFHAQGSVLWPLEGSWNVQGNFAFNTDRIDTGGPDFAIDTWKFGGTAFWRQQNEGVLGGELWYQSLDVGMGYLDGVGIAARGEYFFSPTLTFGGRIAYSNYDGGTSIDEWTINALGRYYAQPNLGLTLGVNYSSLNDDGGEGLDDWTVRGEAEYLFADCDTSVFADVRFGSVDPDAGATDSDQWGLGLGLRLRFGTTGALVQRDRTGPLQELGGAHFLF